MDMIVLPNHEIEGTCLSHFDIISRYTTNIAKLCHHSEPIICPAEKTSPTKK